jgi:hypothetical protein
MTTQHPLARHRRVALGGALLLAVVGIGALGVAALPAGTPPTAGQSISPTSGNSSTSFTLNLTAPDNVCPGDSVTGGFLWSTFMVPASADPAILQYDTNGPRQTVSGSGGYSLAFAQPLFSEAGTPIVGQTTGLTSGLLTPLPKFRLAVFPPGFVAPGDYEVGYACHKAGLTERYWSTTITITANPSGGPAQVNFAEVPSTTTTTTIAPSTTDGTTTTTTVPGSTTTTVAPTSTTSTTSTSTTSTTSTTSSTTSTTSTTTTVFTTLPAFTTLPDYTVTTLYPGPDLPDTGGSMWRTIVLWAVVAIVAGRFAVLASRPIRARSSRSR